MYQVIQQTREEQEKMYMKLPKKDLVDLLINCQDLLEVLKEQANAVFLTPDK
jgi:hypothetical protein